MDIILELIYTIIQNKIPNNIKEYFDMLERTYGDKICVNSTTLNKYFKNKYSICPSILIDDVDEKVREICLDKIQIDLIDPHIPKTYLFHNKKGVVGNNNMCFYFSSVRLLGYMLSMIKIDGQTINDLDYSGFQNVTYGKIGNSDKNERRPICRW